MKRVYLACSIRGGRSDQPIYAEIAEVIKQHAHLLSELFADGALTHFGSKKPADNIYATDMDWLLSADAVVAEVTNPSLGVGYELARAEAAGIPVLALYRPAPDRRLSAMILGAPGIAVAEYSDVSEVAPKITEFIGEQI